MTSNVDRLFNLFGYLFAGLIPLLIGYSVVPSMFLFACCCVIGTLAVVVGVAALIYWSKAN